MLGVLLLLVFLILGIAITNRIFSDEPLYIRVWSGLLVGLLSLMWNPVPFAVFLGFSVISHLLALALMTVLYIMVRQFYKERGGLKYSSNGTDYILYAILVPVFILTAYMLNTHVLLPGKDGGLYVGQSTWGDLSLHLGIITSIAVQQKFPPEYSIFPGHMLNYPFLVDSLSSSLYLFGTPLRWAVLIPSYILAATLISGFFIFAYEVLKHKYAAAFSAMLFFFNGGFGFIYFMDGLRKDPSNFTRMFDEFYHTPTNYNEHFIRWSNTICDMIIPQRTTLAGWTFVLFGLWLLYRAITRGDRRCFIYAGIIAGLLPMIHTHSFLALGVISIVWFFVYLTQSKDKKNYVINWVYFGAITAIAALPQLFYWTFRQSAEGGFLKLYFDWANEGDVWLWFWVKNVGLVFILLFPALLASGRKMLSFYSGAVILFIIADLVLFQPNSYDNNKLFYIWYMFSVILVSAYVWTIYNRMEGIRARWSLIAVLLVMSTFSGVLTMGREINSSLLLFSSNDVEAADFIKANTPEDAVFLTADNHNNLVSSLAGRNILCGTASFLGFHGINMSNRASEVEQMYKSPGSFGSLSAKNKVDYVLFSGWEKDKFKVDAKYFQDNYPKVYEKGDIEIFAISGRAKQKIK